MVTLPSRVTLLKGFTILLGGYFLLVGIGCLVAPQEMAAQFSITTIGVHGASTVRGDLGGLFIAMGLLSLGGFRSNWRGSRFLLAVALLLATIAACRLPGLLLDGFDPFTLMLAVVEALLAGLFTLAATVAGQQEER